MGAQSEMLRRTNGSSEEVFLAIGARLHDFYSRAAEIERMAGAIAGHILSEEISREMNSLREKLDRIDDYLTHAQGETERSTTTLQTILDLINHVEAPLDGFKKIIKNLHMLSTAVKIESARLGEGAAGFNNLADDVERLSILIKSKSASILEEKERLASMISGTLGHVADCEAGQRRSVTMILDNCRESLVTLDDIHQRCAGAAPLIASRSAEISRSIGDVVTSLQFHDITRQQIEHVQEALDDMRERLGADAVPMAAAPPARLVGEAGDICELQAAQLRHAREELVLAVDTVVGSLRDVARMEAGMSADAREMAGNADMAGHSFFAEMENGMVNVTSALGENIKANQNLASAMATVVGSVGDIASFVNDIEEIGSEIELIALNSQVKAANTGDGGAALGVLAEAIQNLSGEARARTSAVSETLRHVTEATERLTGGADCAGQSTFGEVEGVVEELKVLLHSVRNANETILSLLSRMDEAVRDLSEDIDASTGGITVHETVAGVVDGVMAELDEVVRQVRLMVPETSQAAKEQRLRDLAGRYTMHSERRVHGNVVAGAGGGTVFAGLGAPAFDAGGGGDFGDNVELF